MNNDIKLGKDSIILLYYRYKDSPVYSITITLLVIATCLMILINVIIPQWQNWFSIRHEIEVTRQRIKTLNDNISFINSVPKFQLDSNLQLTTQSLPGEKDFSGILTVISDAAIKAGVILDDYTFVVGDIASSSATFSKTIDILPNTKIDISIVGKLSAINRYITLLEQKIPVLEVSSISIDADKATLSLKFFYKPYPQIRFSDTEPISPLSIDEQALMKKMVNWRNSVDYTIEDIPVNASVSGNMPLF